MIYILVILAIVITVITGGIKKPIIAFFALFATQYIFPNFIGRYVELVGAIIIVWLYAFLFLFKGKSLTHLRSGSMIEKLMWSMTISLCLAGVLNTTLTGHPSDALTAVIMAMGCGPLIYVYLQLDPHERIQGQLVLFGTATLLSLITILINYTGDPTLFRYFIYKGTYTEEMIWSRVVPIGYWAIAPVGLWFALRLYFDQRKAMMKIVIGVCVTTIFYSMVLTLARSLLFGTLSAMIVVVLFSFLVSFRHGMRWLVLILVVGVLFIGLASLTRFTPSAILSVWENRLLEAPPLGFENSRATMTIKYARILMDDCPLLGATQQQLLNPMDRDNLFFTTIWWQFGLIPALIYLFCILLTLGYLLRMVKIHLIKHLNQTQPHAIIMTGCCIQLFWNMASGYSLVLTSAIPLAFVLAEVYLTYIDTMNEVYSISQD